jgi:hypothetical protein
MVQSDDPSRSERGCRFLALNLWSPNANHHRPYEQDPARERRGFSGMTCFPSRYSRAELFELVLAQAKSAGYTGQLLISHDLLGNFVGGIAPKFVRKYADLGTTIQEAFRAYAADVRAGTFPSAEHCYPLDPAAEVQFKRERVARQKLSEEPSTTQADRSAILQRARVQARSGG